MFVIIYVVFINLFGFFSMYRDKQLAIKQQRRVPERKLINIAIIGGSVGSFIAMRMFRHKTRHTTFSVGLPLLVMLHLGILLFILFYIQA
ncbi:DUF1294 domain-containing protein [Alkalicoccobacillus porphyridii]|uniref:DUF1294 domain-containing protein n=1 Tax=Alkalicoccobacillus porphyridii TaxID=2597270 RepID=A0A554A4J7_9BACI|nr:DUF1294 domain-containing protein [Alkalicoccobacillus porphyridii]